MPVRNLIILGACLLASACSVIAPEYQHTCSEPRPEVCTREYVPVCGVKSDSSTGLYGNGCSACSNPDVIGYNEGACPQPRT